MSGTLQGIGADIGLALAGGLADAAKSGIKGLADSGLNQAKNFLTSVKVNGIETQQLTPAGIAAGIEYATKGPVLATQAGAVSDPKEAKRLMDQATGMLNWLKFLTSNGVLVNYEFDGAGKIKRDGGGRVLFTKTPLLEKFEREANGNEGGWLVIDSENVGRFGWAKYKADTNDATTDNIFRKKGDPVRWTKAQRKGFDDAQEAERQRRQAAATDLENKRKAAEDAAKPLQDLREANAKLERERIERDNRILKEHQENVRLATEGPQPSMSEKISGGFNKFANWSTSSSSSGVGSVIKGGIDLIGSGLSWAGGFLKDTFNSMRKTGEGVDILGGLGGIIAGFFAASQVQGFMKGSFLEKIPFAGFIASALTLFGVGGLAFKGVTAYLGKGVVAGQTANAGSTFAAVDVNGRRIGTTTPAPEPVRTSTRITPPGTVIPGMLAPATVAFNARSGADATRGPDIIPADVLRPDGSRERIVVSSNTAVADALTEDLRGRDAGARQSILAQSVAAGQRGYADPEVLHPGAWGKFVDSTIVASAMVAEEVDHAPATPGVAQSSRLRQLGAKVGETIAAAPKRWAEFMDPGMTPEYG